MAKMKWEDILATTGKKQKKMQPRADRSREYELPTKTSLTKRTKPELVEELARVYEHVHSALASAGHVPKSKNSELTIERDHVPTMTELLKQIWSFRLL